MYKTNDQESVYIQNIWKRRSDTEKLSKISIIENYFLQKLKRFQMKQENNTSDEKLRLNSF